MIKIPNDVIPCSPNCRFKFGLVLTRTTHKLCLNCKTCCVSFYEDSLCFRCAKPENKEFEKHHKKCFKNFKSKL